MNHKVLLADDSQTIQKVIKLTLTNEPFEIDVAEVEEEIFTKVNGGDYSLILLDFDISKNSDGYEIATKIKHACPKTPIVMLFGTFDTIDDDLLTKSGVEEKVIKPFDSLKFVELCNQLVNNGRTERDFQEMVQVSSSSDEDWVINNESVEMSEQSNNDELVNALKQGQKEVENEQLNLNEHVTTARNGDDMLNELSSWGIDVPGKIDERDDFARSYLSQERPSPIEEENTQNEEEHETDFVLERPNQEAYEDTPAIIVSSSDDEITIPSDKDLEYPELNQKFNQIVGLDRPGEDILNEEDSSESDDSDTEEKSHKQSFENLKLSSRLIPLDDLNLKAEEKQVDKIGEVTETRDFSLKLKDENSNEDFWSAEEENLTEEKVEAQSPISSTPQENANIDVEELKEQIKAELTANLESLVRSTIEKIFERKVEEVAWEVIPDLAENLIKEEIQNISRLAEKERSGENRDFS